MSQGLLVQASGAEQPTERIREEKISGFGPIPAEAEIPKPSAQPSTQQPAMVKSQNPDPARDPAKEPSNPDPNLDDPYQTRPPNPLEQIQAQAEVDEELGEEPPHLAPPGATKQLLVVMRHGQRIDEVGLELKTNGLSVRLRVY